MDITPNQVVLSPYVNGNPSQSNVAGGNYGVDSVVVDPQNPNVIYMGTSGQGIYKSTDCGNPNTWVHIDTNGPHDNNGTILDGSRTALVIDPSNTQTLYANAIYGNAPWQVFKSTDGGITWSQMIPNSLVPAIMSGVHAIEMDPSDPQHLLVLPHFTCGSPYSQYCIFETKNGGTDWDVIQNVPESGESTYVYMQSSTTWYYTSTDNNLYKTIDGGITWQSIYNGSVVGFYADPVTGALFAGTQGVSISSIDDGASWTSYNNTIPLLSITGNSTAIYASGGSCVGISDTSLQPYYSSPNQSPFAFTTIQSPSMYFGGYLVVDPTNHILYSANCDGGAWRYIVP